MRSTGARCRLPIGRMDAPSRARVDFENVRAWHLAGPPRQGHTALSASLRRPLRFASGLPCGARQPGQRRKLASLKQAAPARKRATLTDCAPQRRKGALRAVCPCLGGPVAGLDCHAHNSIASTMLTTSVTLGCQPTRSLLLKIGAMGASACLKLNGRFRAQ